MRSLPVFAFVAAALVPSGARAYTPAEWHPDIADLEVPEPLRVLRESIVLRCFRDDLIPVCEIENSIELENPTDGAVESVVTARAQDVEHLLLTSGSRKAVDENPDGLHKPLAAPLAVALAANARATVVVHVLVRGLKFWVGHELVTGPLAARHPILAPAPGTEGYLRLSYGPLKAPYTVTQQMKGDLGVELDQPERTILLHVAARASHHPWGGPFAGAGTTTGSNSALRVRAGWEFAPRPWLIGALGAESDLRKLWRAAATIEAASPTVAFLPSLSLGFGVPVQFGPTTRAGVRFISTATFPYVGVAFTYDVYPSTASESILTEFAIVARVGL